MHIAARPIPQYTYGHVTGVQGNVYTFMGVHHMHDMYNIIRASEAKPLSSGWCETGSHGTLKPDGIYVGSI